MSKPRKLLGTFIFAILAGLCISLGCMVYLAVLDMFTGAKIAGAVLFTIGLFMICTRGYNLFTGKVCYVFDNDLFYALSLPVIWIGNLTGCVLSERLLSLTGISAKISGNAVSLVEAKNSSSLLSLFILGIFCNILIYFAVNGYAKFQHEIAKYLSLFFGVTVFILAGTEHCVADMFYYAASGSLYSSFGDSMLRLLIITCGNIVGGVMIPLIEKLYRKLVPEQ